MLPDFFRFLMHFLMVIATLRCDDDAGGVFGDDDGYGDCYGVMTIIEKVIIIQIIPTNFGSPIL